MSNQFAARLVAGVAMFACSIAWATGPSSANYAIPSSALNAGVGDMASVSYKLSSSLGDPFFAAGLSSTNYQVNPGFWGTIVGAAPGCLLDIDGNGSIDALTDGLLILRAMFGLSGTSVTNGAIGGGATRTTWAQIQPAIHFPQLDIDGNGVTDALTDGLMILRSMFGLTGTSVTTGAVAAGAPRSTWAQVRSYLNASCGAAFAP